MVYETNRIKMNLDNICSKAKPVPPTDEVLRCEFEKFCEHQITLRDGKNYCRVPLNPDKYEYKFRREENG